MSFTEETKKSYGTYFRTNNKDLNITKIDSNTNLKTLKRPIHVADEFDPNSLKQSENAVYLITNESYGLPYLMEAVYEASKAHTTGLKVDVILKDVNNIVNNIDLKKIASDYDKSVQKFGSTKKQVQKFVMNASNHVHKKTANLAGGYYYEDPITEKNIKKMLEPEPEPNSPPTGEAVNLKFLKKDSNATVKNSKNNDEKSNKKVAAHKLNALFQENMRDANDKSLLTPFESLAHQFLKISFYLGTKNYLAFIQTAAVINEDKKRFINQLKLNDKVNKNLSDIQQMAANYKDLKQKDEIKSAYRFLNEIIVPESNKIQNSFNPNKISERIKNMQQKKEKYNSSIKNLEKRESEIQKNQNELQKISKNIDKLKEYERQKKTCRKR